MRFLFGDSTPFEEGYHVLDGLRHWVDASVDLLLTARALEERERRVEEHTQARLRELKAADDFFQAVVERIGEELGASARPDLMAPHARLLIDDVRGVAHAFRERSVGSFGKAEGALVAEIFGLSGALGARLSRYLLSRPLPVRAWDLTLSYPERTAEGALTLRYAEGLGACVKMNLGAHPTWSHPPLMGDLCSGLQLEVGTKRSLLRGTTSPAVLTLDDLHLVHLEISAETMRLRLSQRPDPDAVILALEAKVASGVVRGRIERTEKAHPSPTSDEGSLRRLHETLRRLTHPLLRHRGTLTALHVDGDERPISEATRTLLARVGHRLSPMVTAIFERSPNANELSLKREHDDGRREELYLCVDELHERIGALPRSELRLFAPMPFLLGDEALAASATDEGGAPAAPVGLATWVELGATTFPFDHWPPNPSSANPSSANASADSWTDGRLRESKVHVRPESGPRRQGERIHGELRSNGPPSSAPTA